MRFGPPALSVLSLFQPIQRVLGKHICLRPIISFCLYFFREDHRKKMIAWPKRILSPFIISSPVCIYLLILCLFNYCTCIIITISCLIFLFLPCAELVLKMAYFFESRCGSFCLVLILRLSFYYLHCYSSPRHTIDYKYKIDTRSRCTWDLCLFFGTKEGLKGRHIL